MARYYDVLLCGLLETKRHALVVPEIGLAYRTFTFSEMTESIQKRGNCAKLTVTRAHWLASAGSSNLRPQEENPPVVVRVGRKESRQ